MHRHRLDPLSLLSGALFALVGVVFLLVDVRWLPAVELRWLGPLVVLGLGLWLLLSAALTSADRRWEAREVAPAARQEQRVRTARGAVGEEYAEVTGDAGATRDRGDDPAEAQPGDPAEHERGEPR